MDTQYRVQRVLCHAQYGDILLCEVAAGIMTTSDKADELDSQEATDHSDVRTPDELMVIKQVSWAIVQAKREETNATFQLSDDPMVEVDVAAKICASGNHKNVVQYQNVLRGDRGSFGIVMEYCNEGDLLKRLDQMPENRLCEQEALIVLRQVSDGLRFLHDVVGVAHRDVSLENVMVHDGVCKIGDFGLSTRIQNDGARRRRFVEGRVGKLGYMAPEVAAGEAYDPVLADIWSLGMLFFIALTGSPLVELASVECSAFRAYCRLGLLRVLDDWKLLDTFHEETVSLCESMLQLDPRNRITLDQVRTHAAFDTIATVP